MNIKEFRTLLLKNVRDRGMKVDKDAIIIATDAFFDELSKIADDKLQIFVNERVFNARMRSKGE